MSNIRNNPFPPKYIYACTKTVTVVQILVDCSLAEPTVWNQNLFKQIAQVFEQEHV